MGSDGLYSTTVSEDLDLLIFDSWNIQFLFIAVVINKKVPEITIGVPWQHYGIHLKTFKCCHSTSYWI